MSKQPLVQCVQCDVRYSRQTNSECPRCRSRVVKEDYPQTLTAVLSSRKNRMFACCYCSFQSSEPFCENCVSNSSMIRVEDPDKGKCRICSEVVLEGTKYCDSCEDSWTVTCAFCGDYAESGQKYCEHCLKMGRDKQDAYAKDNGSLAASLMETEPEELTWAKSLNPYAHKGSHKNKLICSKCEGYVVNETFLQNGLCKSCRPKPKGMGSLMQAQEELKARLDALSKGKIL